MKRDSVNSSYNQWSLPESLQAPIPDPKDGITASKLGSMGMNSYTIIRPNRDKETNQ